jgi:hypothetical protein
LHLCILEKAVDNQISHVICSGHGISSEVLDARS